MGAESEPVAGAGLLLALDRQRGAPTLHEQLEQRLRELVRSGRLPPGTRLPSSRSLSAELGISRGIVIEAYAQLTAEGYLSSAQGAPTRVAATAGVEREPLRASSLEGRHRYDFDPALPDVAAFPADRWMRSLRRALTAAPLHALAHGDPRGLPELRDELMSYLGRARGAAAEPEHTIICTGFTEAFALVCRTLRDRGVETVAVEDPGWAQQRLIAERAGLVPVPIGVDEHGLDVAELAWSGCDVAVLTPAHQFPTGVVLSSERRTALLEWAEERDALIVEDDYDSELRYDRMPLGAMQGLAPERVCLIGSLSKRLVPGLRLGWMLSPSWLTGSLTYEKAVSEGASPVLEQLALTDFIARGELDRHLRRTRLRLRERREALAGALAELIPGAAPTGIPAGLHALLPLPAAVEEEAVLSRAAAAGVGVEGLAWHRLRPGPGGLVLGFASMPEAAIARGVRLLAGAIAQP